PPPPNASDRPPPAGRPGAGHVLRRGRQPRRTVRLWAAPVPDAAPTCGRPPARNPTTDRRRLPRSAPRWAAAADRCIAVGVRTSRRTTGKRAGPPGCRAPCRLAAEQRTPAEVTDMLAAD